eukprot:TRINITY_DN1760_c1_g3_i1.p1 TRINITY_DN1760_c1_g3~~TRINITY_DN1760_c1_g3_i1.p1  ORF type:complete len:323 (+),score=207.96 TRINITY_DN1760_c1_g3_i1:60-1028(+)
MADAEMGPIQHVMSLDDGVRENVLALQSLQAKYQEHFNKFLEENNALTKKYEEKFAPLYAKRKEIVTGARDPTEQEKTKGAEIVSKIEVLDEEEEEEAKEAEEEKAEPMKDAEKGIPKFWLTALENNDELGDTVQEWDQDILAHLVDISCESLKDGKEGFELKFEFEKNSFFSETVLTKRYITKVDKDDGEDLLVKGEGCAITWAEGCNPTVTTKTKKQTSKSGKGTRMVSKEVPQESFFKLFYPPYAPDEELTEEIADEMEADFSIGGTIKDSLIPRAVEWYTGEAADLHMDLPPNFMMGGGDSDDEEGGPAPGQQDCKQQ